MQAVYKLQGFNYRAYRDGSNLSRVACVCQRVPLPAMSGRGVPGGVKAGRELPFDNLVRPKASTPGKGRSSACLQTLVDLTVA